MAHVVVAPDKFKGSLSAPAVARALAADAAAHDRPATGAPPRPVRALGTVK
jgi:glycerate kinase